ncbi:TetR/AcrR family transcriptional regulator [Novosphingobium sp. TH158]|uniref:TetR/AcrR family transcriptional regulator n=1 Tax=Novosphingobium sp. TH158 TaxID=2067455 RepID=UPI000C7971AC|nr:TetR/AcrR family transcriptional regulator [Novosphingobium sp. TH158]PLK26060.1 hypothetical protein C0V78_03560 [Novosphingobium sp. TH158]
MPRPASPTRREDLLNAAREEFIARGYASARMEDIAARVGISKAAVYLQFASKEAVFRALVSDIVANSMPRMAPADASALPVAQQLRQFIIAAFALVTSPEVIFLPRLIVGEGHKFPELVRFYHDEAIVRIMGIIEALLMKGIESGELDCADPRHAGRSIAGGIILTALWLTVLEPVGAEKLDVARAAQIHADTVINGLLARKEA